MRRVLRFLTAAVAVGLVQGGVQSLSRSISQAQAELMADPKTSHPFYWGAFIILGDGSRSITG